MQLGVARRELNLNIKAVETMQKYSCFKQSYSCYKFGYLFNSDHLHQICMFGCMIWFYLYVFLGIQRRTTGCVF